MPKINLDKLVGNDFFKNNLLIKGYDLDVTNHPFTTLDQFYEINLVAHHKSRSSFVRFEQFEEGTEFWSLFARHDEGEQCFIGLLSYKMETIQVCKLKSTVKGSQIISEIIDVQD